MNRLIVGCVIMLVSSAPMEAQTALSHERNGFRSFDPALMNWTSVDPLASNCPQISPYAYCTADPVNRIDLLGLTDILVMESGFHKFIEDQVDRAIQLNQENIRKLESINFDYTNPSYENILSSGILRDDILSTIPNVLIGNDFVTYKSTGNCLKAAISQNNTKVMDSRHRIDMFMGTNEVNYDEGIENINDQLQKGQSIVAGVHTGANHGNHNISTGHFVNIVGRGIEYSSGNFRNFYNYYDCGSNNCQIGTNMINNRLIFGHTNMGSRILYDAKIEHIRNVPRYILTEVRRNCEK